MIDRHMSVEKFLIDFVENTFVAAPESIISIVLRTIIIAFLVLIVIRWLGNKGLGQLSPFELLIVIGLGTVVGDPMIYPELNISSTLTAIIVVIVVFKLIDYLSARSNRFNKIAVTHPIQLVRSGVLLEEGFKKAKINEDEFKSQMRLNGIKNLHDIQESYLEINGQISFIKADKNQS